MPFVNIFLSETTLLNDGKKVFDFGADQIFNMTAITNHPIPSDERQIYIVLKLFISLKFNMMSRSASFLCLSVFLDVCHFRTNFNNRFNGKMNKSRSTCTIYNLYIIGNIMYPFGIRQ